MKAVRLHGAKDLRLEDVEKPTTSTKKGFPVLS